VTFLRIYLGTVTFDLAHCRCKRILFRSAMNMQAYTGETISKCTVRICHNVLNYAWKNKILSFNYECQDMDCLQYGTLRLELLRVNKKERQKYNTGH